MQTVAVSIPLASSFTFQQVSVVCILPTLALIFYFVTLSHFDLRSVGSPLWHTQHRPIPMTWDFSVPIFLTDQVLSFLALGKYRPCDLSQRPLGKWALAFGSDMILGIVQEAIWLPPKKAILLCSTRGITWTKTTIPLLKKITLNFSSWKK